MAKIKIYFISFLLTLPILLASVFIPVNISSHSELLEVKLGLPFKFLIQDQSHLDPPLPWRVNFSSPLENPTQILWPQFFLSVIVIFTLVSLVLRVLWSRQRYLIRNK